MITNVLLFVVVVWVMLGGVFGCAVISNRFCAAEQHFKAKILGVIGIFFGLGLLSSFIVGSQIAIPDLLKMDLFEQLVVAIVFITGMGIEAVIASHYDPNHGM